MPNDQRDRAAVSAEAPGDADDKTNPSVPSMVHQMVAAQLREFADEAQQVQNEVKQSDTPPDDNA